MTVATGAIPLKISCDDFCRGWCGEMKMGVNGFDVDDEYARYHRRQRIHRYHLIGYAVSSVLILIGMLLFWH